MSLLVNQRSFPAEIVEVIIDRVHRFTYPTDDYDHDPRVKPKDERRLALKSCSLVCRAWLPRSRYYLFRTTTVSLLNHRIFIQLIASPNCSFLNSIDTLVLKEGYNGHLNNSDSDTPFWRVDPENVWLPKTLSTATLPIFPNIRKLLIITGAFYVVSKEDCEKLLSLLSGLPSLTHLALIECVFSTVDDVIRVLSSCQALESARLEDVMFMRSSTPEITAQSHLLRLPASLSSLAITVGDGDSDILQIISVAGPSLKHLSMYRNLRKLSVVFGKQDDLAAEAKELITQKLKPLTDKNLSVEIVDYGLNYHQFVEARLGW
ncbi:hypothetical protein F5146DRAFT_1228422 [Armillaria mellea]|nr:hypothetical protein F5146DRAFT_1228422 [Armillaria mellea]